MSLREDTVAQVEREKRFWNLCGVKYDHHSKPKVKRICLRCRTPFKSMGLRLCGSCNGINSRVSHKASNVIGGV